MNNGVFIPIEIMNREYISKLLLSIELIKRGMPVIIGHKAQVIKLALKSNEPGILFYKSTMAGGMERTYQLLKKKNFGFVSQDEEAGIVFKNFKDFYNSRPSLKSIGDVDFFFSWGDDEYRFLVKRFTKKVVKNYGALRSCLWGDLGKKIYHSNIVDLKKKFGNYILIVSNLADYNSYLSEKQTIEHLSQYKDFNLKKFKKACKVQKYFFYQYVDIIKFITMKLNKKVIVRPHPGEGKKLWEEALRGIENVHVESEGELLPWILASEFIIQNGCTSAIEASTANIPVISYIKKKDLNCLSLGIENIANKLSINVFGKKQLTQTINKIDLIWNKPENKKKRLLYLNKKLKYYGTTKSAEKIAQKIIDYTGTPNPIGYEKLGKDSILYYIYEIYRNFKFRPKTIKTIMDLQKRDTLSYSKIQRDIENLLNIMNINKKVKIKRVERNTYYLFPFSICNDK